MTAVVLPAPPLVPPPPPRARSVDRGAAGLLGVTVAVATVSLTVAPGPFRTVVTLAFLLSVPGAVVAGHLRLGSAPPALRAIVSVGAGVAVTTLTAVGMLAARWWHPAVAFGILLALTAAALTVRLARAWRAGPAPGAAIGLPRSPAPTASSLAVPLLALVAVACWGAGLREVESTALGSVGLVAVLSVPVLVSYPLLAVAVVAELVTRQRTWVLAGVTALGVLMVYGLQPLSEPVTRLPVAWLHSGFADYIGDHGTVLANFDGRFCWPGFFAAVAFVVRAAGGTQSQELTTFAPVVLAGLAVLGVRAIAVRVLGDGRAAWLATWVALLANWTEQDYFSPQGTTFVLLLAAVALTLHALVAPGLLERRATSWRTPPVPANTPADRTAATLGVLLIAAAVVPSHQLTPFALAGLLGVLRLGGRLWSTWLPVLILVLTLTWTIIAAREFWISQLDVLFGTIGDPAAGVADKIAGDVGRLAVLGARFAITGGVVALAVAGLWILHRRGRAALGLGALAAAPFVLALLQSYGGEILMRCYLFSLPFLAVGAGIALHRLLPVGGDRPSPRVRRAGRRATGTTAGVLVLGLLALLLVTARGGNDAYSAPSDADVAAQEFIYRTAADGDTAAAVGPFGPLRFRRLDTVDQLILTFHCRQIDDLLGCVAARPPDHIYLSPVHDAWGRLVAGLPEGWLARLRTDLETRQGYRVVFEQDGRVVLRHPSDTRRAGKALR